MKVTFLILIGLLSGCSVLSESYNMKYDQGEYRLITDIRVDAQNFQDECTDPVQAKVNATIIKRRTDLFEAYVQYIPLDTDVQKASIELGNIAKGLEAQYKKAPVSPTFCRIKLEVIEHAAKSMQAVIGNKPR